MGLYLVEDSEECYRYVVKAGTYFEAIELVKNYTGKRNWDWSASVCDNDVIIESEPVK